MKIVISLKDSKYCNGCPLIECWGGKESAYTCKLYDKFLKSNFSNNIGRPTICIKENGE